MFVVNLKLKPGNHITSFELTSTRVPDHGQQSSSELLYYDAWKKMNELYATAGAETHGLAVRLTPGKTIGLE